MAVASALSRKQVDRAGKLIREFSALALARDEEALVLLRPKLMDALVCIDRWRGEHTGPLVRVNAGLRYYVRQAGGEPEVTQRLKRLPTILNKLEREPTMALSKMEDIGGVRAILPHQEQILDVAARLNRAKRWEIRRERYYIDGGAPGPKDDGYRAVHLIVVKDGHFVEIQLRTPWQDAWAQSVEQDTRRLHTDLKFGAGPDDLREYYRMAADLFAMRAANIEPPKEFMEDLANQYAGTRRYFPTQQHGDA